MRYSLSSLTCLFSLLCAFSYAQVSPKQNAGKSPQTIDKVVAVVGDEPVLLSEMEIQIHQTAAAQNLNAEALRCYMLDQIIQKKILLSRAKTDSLKVTNEQVESELN